jgi:hypothetical protein
VTKQEQQPLSNGRLLRFTIGRGARSQTAPRYSAQEAIMVSNPTAGREGLAKRHRWQMEGDHSTPVQKIGDAFNAAC